MTRWTWLIALVLVACAGSTEQVEPESGTSGGDAAAVVCQPGADQSCNDDPAISSLHGHCQPDGSCECAVGIEKNPATGRCL